MSKAKVLPFPMPGDFEDAVQKPTALVIEDNALVRTSEKLLLRYDGFNVVTAEDGKTAVEIFGEHHRDIDVVITDCQLPEMSGQEVCLEINETSPQTPVMLVSTDARYMSEDEREPFDAVLRKPFNATDFIQTARELVL